MIMAGKFLPGKKRLDEATLYSIWFYTVVNC